MSQEEINEMYEICESHQEQIDDELQALIKASSERILKAHQNHYQPIVDKLERQVAEQNLRNEATKKRSEELGSQAGDTDVVLTHFSDHIAYLRIKQHSANQRSKIFKAWKDLSLDRQIIIDISQHLYLDQPMLRILFKRWHRKMRSIRSTRLKRDLRRQCQMDLRLKETEASQRINALQAELASIKNLLAEHEKQHADIEKKLRQAFMRGVTNLNLEAMDVFGEIPLSNVTSTGMPVVTPQKEEDEDQDDFYVEPAPKISVIRHR